MGSQNQDVELTAGQLCAGIFGIFGIVAWVLLTLYMTWHYVVSPMLAQVPTMMSTM